MSEFWLDEKEADKAESFFEEFLVHVKGEWASHPFELEDWQRDFIRNLFGWKRKDGTRKYRWAYLEIPRKNGKSTLCAGIALYLLLADGEEGAEIYSAAADRGQAHIVFDMAKQMVQRNAKLSRILKPYRTSIAFPKTASRYESLSSDAFTKLGFNAHGVIFDEIAIQPNRELYDALRTSMGARRQPLFVMLTTAGVADKTSIGWELADYARKVADGSLKDDSFYAVIYSADSEADWTDEKLWEKVNPNYGVSIKPDFIRQECETAKASPASQNTFRRFYLNQWVEQEDRYIDMSVYDECAVEVDQEALEHERCFAGLDISSTTDLSSLVLLFPPEEKGQLWEVLPYFWIPGESIHKRVERDRVPYDAWVRDGDMEATNGNVVDQDHIRYRIGEIASGYEIVGLGVDPWNSQQLQTQLLEDGHNVMAFRQGYVSMNAPTKELLALLMSKEIAVGTNPVLRWNIANLVVKTDPAGNVKPDKGAAIERIDGAVALIMALGLAIASDEEPLVYNDPEYEIPVL